MIIRRWDNKYKEEKIKNNAFLNFDTSTSLNSDSFCFFLILFVLYYRSFYFEAMFRPGGMVESSKGEIQMARHDKNTFCRMMEFIYTGTPIIIRRFL